MQIENMCKSKWQRSQFSKCIYVRGKEKKYERKEMAAEEKHIEAAKSWIKFLKNVVLFLHHPCDISFHARQYLGDLRCRLKSCG